MAKHHPDLVFCRKQPGISLGRLCEKCDGKCVICDSYVRPHVLVHICDECNYGSFEGRCIICGAPGISDAYYCRECTLQEKDVGFFFPSNEWTKYGRHVSSIVEYLRCPLYPELVQPPFSRAFFLFTASEQRDGCPKIINLGSARTDLFYGAYVVAASTRLLVKPGSRKFVLCVCVSHRCPPTTLISHPCSLRAERKKYGFKKR